VFGYHILRDQRYNTHCSYSQSHHRKPILHVTYLYTEITSIHIVAKEQVPCLRWITTDLKEFHEVKVLSMYVAADRDRGIHLKEIWLAFKDPGSGIYDP